MFPLKMLKHVKCFTGVKTTKRPRIAERQVLFAITTIEVSCAADALLQTLMHMFVFTLITLALRSTYSCSSSRRQARIAKAQIRCVIQTRECN